MALLGLGEIAIARTHGEPGRFAHDRAADDFDGKIQIDDRAPDDGELLAVFLAEVGALGANEVKKLGDDGDNALEEDGARSPAKNVRHRSRGNHLGERFATAVHFLGGGGENSFHTRFLAKFQISLERSRIGVQVFAGGKLQGVDKNTRDNQIVFRHSLLNEAQVAGVQRAHRGNESNLFALATLFQIGAQVGNCLQQTHSPLVTPMAIDSFYPSANWRSGIPCSSGL